MSNSLENFNKGNTGSKLVKLSELTNFFLGRNFLTDKHHFSLLLSYFKDSGIKFMLEKYPKLGLKYVKGNEFHPIFDPDLDLTFFLKDWDKVSGKERYSKYVNRIYALRDQYHKLTLH